MFWWWRWNYITLVFRIRIITEWVFLKLSATASSITFTCKNLLVFPLILLTGDKKCPLIGISTDWVSRTWTGGGGDAVLWLVLWYCVLTMVLPGESSGVWWPGLGDSSPGCTTNCTPRDHWFSLYHDVVLWWRNKSSGRRKRPSLYKLSIESLRNKNKGGIQSRKKDLKTPQASTFSTIWFTRGDSNFF